MIYYVKSWICMNQTHWFKDALNKKNKTSGYMEIIQLYNMILILDCNTNITFPFRVENRSKLTRYKFCSTKIGFNYFCSAMMHFYLSLKGLCECGFNDCLCRIWPLCPRISMNRCPRLSILSQRFQMIMLLRLSCMLHVVHWTVRAHVQCTAFAC